MNDSLNSFSSRSATFRFRLAAAALVVLLPLASCRNLPEHPAPVAGAAGGTVAGESPDSREILLGGRLLHAIAAGDFTAFSDALAGRFTGKITQKDFQTSCANLNGELGKLTGERFLIRLDTPLVKNLVWVTDFERRTKAGETVKTQLLFRLVTAAEGEGESEGGNEEPRVMGFGFF